jgi:hypothetical protein
MADPVVIQEPEACDVMEYPVGNIEVKRGELLSLESSTIIVMNAATDDATFPGFALGQKNVGFDVPAQLLVAQKGVVVLDATSDQYVPPGQLMWASENAVATATGNTIGYVWRKTAAAAVRVKAYFNVPALQKLFAVQA